MLDQEFFAAWMLLAAFLGLSIGSFLNVLIWRLPRMLSRQWEHESQLTLGLSVSSCAAPFTLSQPGSHCPHCGAAVRWRHNVPVFSWLYLRGRCADCAAPISWRYPVIETLTALLFCACAWKFGFTLKAGLAMAFCAALMALAWIDIDTRLLPDALTLPLLWTGLVANAGWRGFVATDEAVLGAAAGYGVLWLVCAVFALMTRRQGMGRGDFKLLAALGAWLGVQSLAGLILIASSIGVAVGLFFRWRHGEQQAPFGPGLALAGMAVLFTLGA
jgi:leader peptidase (prepilin peptidase)/N-methyltransferase